MNTPPTPKPGPRPGPRPGVRPATQPGSQLAAGSHADAATRPAVPVAPQSNPALWGRVESDGSAYVKTETGERLIGSWQAGTPEEGLAHYGARYDDLATEVVYLEQRLLSHPNEAAHVKDKALELRASLATAAVIGDLAALEKRLTTVVEESDEVGKKATEQKQARRAEAIARKEALAAEAEDIADNSTEWKAAGDRIRDILEEWKTIRGIDRKTDDALWKRYSRARDAFKRRRGAHFAELDRGRAAARKAKEALVAQAEELKTSTEWAETAQAFRSLMDQWKQAGRAPRDIDDRLWNQFKAAQDHFFAARHAVQDEKDREFNANAEAKEALLAEYDAVIDPAHGLDQAQAKLREFQEKWEKIGYVPRGRVREFEDKNHCP